MQVLCDTVLQLQAEIKTKSGTSPGVPSDTLRSHEQLFWSLLCFDRFADDYADSSHPHNQHNQHNPHTTPPHKPRAPHAPHAPRAHAPHSRVCSCSQGPQSKFLAPVLQAALDVRGGSPPSKRPADGVGLSQIFFLRTAAWGRLNLNCACARALVRTPHQGWGKREKAIEPVA